MFLYLFMRERGPGDLCVQKLFPWLMLCVCCFMRAPLSRIICAVCFCSITRRCGAGRRFHPWQFVTQLCAPPREPRARETHTTQRAKAEINYIHINKQPANSTPRAPPPRPCYFPCRRSLNHTLIGILNGHQQVHNARAV